jgi:hypothetical protein
MAAFIQGPTGLGSHAYNTVVTGLFLASHPPPPPPSNSGQSGAHAPCISAAPNQSVVITGRTWQSSPLLVPPKYGEDGGEPDESAFEFDSRPQSPALALCLARLRLCLRIWGIQRETVGREAVARPLHLSLSFPHSQSSCLESHRTEMMLPSPADRPASGSRAWRGSPGLHVTAAASQWTVLG